MFEHTDRDADLWGTALTNETAPRAITRLAYLVRLRTDARSKPVRRAAAEVLDMLASSPPDEWFIFTRGDHAGPMDRDDLWCPPHWSRVEAKSEWASFDATPELLGQRGAIACMRAQWSKASSTDDLDTAEAGRIAILTTDAVSLFGGLVLTAPPTKVEAQLSQQWTGVRLAARRAELEAEGKRAPMKQLTDESGLNERTIQRRIKAVNNPPASVSTALSSWGRRTSATG